MGAEQHPFWMRMASINKYQTVFCSEMKDKIKSKQPRGYAAVFPKKRVCVLFVITSFLFLSISEIPSIVSSLNSQGIHAAHAQSKCINGEQCQVNRDTTFSHPCICPHTNACLRFPASPLFGANITVTPLISLSVNKGHINKKRSLC